MEFSHLQVETAEPVISNHSFIVVPLEDGLNIGPKPFKFQKFWMKSGKFVEILQRNWEKNICYNSLRNLC